MCLNKQYSEYASGPKYAKILNMAKFWTWQGVNMRALHSVLNMPEHDFTELWIYLVFWICQVSEYGRVLNMQELRKVLNMPQYGWICLSRREYAWTCLNLQ